jgi:hypothetical protein
MTEFIGLFGSAYDYTSQLNITRTYTPVSKGTSSIRRLVAASNSGSSPPSRLPNSPRSQLQAPNKLTTTERHQFSNSSNQSQSYVTTDD